MGARCDSVPMGLAVGTATATASGTETGTEVASGSVSGLISGLWVSVERKEDGGECAGGVPSFLLLPFAVTFCHCSRNYINYKLLSVLSFICPLPARVCVCAQVGCKYFLSSVIC